MRINFYFKIIILLSLVLNFNAMTEASASENKIKAHIKVLSVELGERSYLKHQNLERAADYIKKELASYGYPVQEQLYYMENKPYRNIIASKEGKDKKKIIIICAHYDSVEGSPGADDNASGVAGLLELARLLSQDNLNKTLKFIAFTCEEPPFYLSAAMGSFQYAQEAKKKKENIEAVLCLESIGFYSQQRGSQEIPLFLKPFYPDQANFIAVVSNLNSGRLLKKVVKEFRQASCFPLEYLMAPIFLVPAISFSDHWSFWKFNYPAVMITDTAFYRNPYYHTPGDTWEKLDYPSISAVLSGLYRVLIKLGSE